jgi:hypothetical protein
MAGFTACRPLTAVGAIMTAAPDMAAARKSRAGWIIAALIIANEIRGLLVVAAFLKAAL